MVLSNKNGVLLSLIFLIFVLSFGLSKAAIPQADYQNNTIQRSAVDLNQKENADLNKRSDLAIDAKHLNCLALNIYYEARGEGRRGMEAVAYVTINRTKSGKFPSSICSVVYQRSQFSWTSARNSSAKGPAWTQSVEVARYVYGSYQQSKDPTFGALYFHASRVNPGWKKKSIIRIGNHVFYR